MNKSVVVDDSEYRAFVANGSESTFRKIFEQYVGLIQYVARKFFTDQGEIDDVVQEVFTRFYEKRAQVEQVEAVKAWLVTTARNYAIDLLRKKDRLNQPIEVNEELEARNDAETFVIELKIQTVRDVLLTLAASKQAIELKMFYVDGMKAKDIATQLNLSVSAVTTNLARQRRKFNELLREKLEPYLDHI